ncbi:MAG: 16S rRNA (uracil(1498)-N(3))-methyltransferase [Phycisphaerae bacterium]|nr:16S rRNA (uracil(1498)-N(3))-methyltransferase [Phycisphaerae bacterium]
MAWPWFVVPSLPDVGASVALPRDEAKHAFGAKRLGAGDGVVLFDGAGGVADARLTGERTRDGSPLVTVDARKAATWSGRRVHLASALPKGDRLATLVEMTAQLGVASLAPLRCERSVVGETESRSDRMRRIQVEACKQARWPFVPELHGETSVDEVCRQRGVGGVREVPILVAHPGGTSLAALARSLPDEVVVCIGPEGGFTDREVAALEAAGARTVSLATSILRVETAAVVAVATLRAEPA